MNNSSFKKIWILSHVDMNEVKSISKELEDNGYDYVLLPFKSRQPDPIIKSLIVLQSTSSLGCFIAIPGYAVSSEYFVMMYKAIRGLFPERNFLLNIIKGGPDEFFDRFEIDTNDINKINKKFIEDIKTISNIKVAFSGMTDEISEISNSYGEFQFVHFKDFDKFVNQDNLKNNLIVRVAICARDTEESAKLHFEKAVNDLKNEKFFSELFLNRLVANTLVGSYDNVKNKILDLKSKGAAVIVVSDILLEEPDRENVHRVVRKIL